MKKIFIILTVAFVIKANAQYTKLLDCTNAISQPFGSVILSANDSVLYGMANTGVLFSLHTDGTALSTYTLPVGGYILGSLIRSGNILYGMTNMGGTYGAGTIFSINTNWSGYTDIYNFPGDSTSADSLGGNHYGGAMPYGTLTLVGNVLYGTTYGAGGADYGNVFSIHTDGTSYMSLLDFNSTNGEHPGYGALAVSGNTLYGTTLYGGASGGGVLFSLHTDGSSYMKLIDFNNANGNMPFGTVVLSGNVLFGAAGGGAYSKGIIYSIHTDGTGYRDLFDFNGTNGLGPMGTLTLSGNRVYGTTGSGGANNNGTIFSIDTNGTGYRDLLDFNNANGSEPRGQLTLNGNNLYGTTVVGGAYGDGVVFSLNLLPAAPTICMVTTDAASSYNYNVVYWDKTPYTNVDSFIVYRSVSSNYVRIGAVSKNALSEFKDTAFSIGGPNGGNPQYGSWQYKLAIRDTMGNIGAMSPYHQTMFVQENNANFSWNLYTVEAGQANPVTGYSFLRDNNNTGTFNVLANLSNTSISTTDPNYSSYPNGNWRIDATGFNCTPTLRLASGNNNTQNTYSSSHSNTTKQAAMGISQITNLNSQITVYPNPNNGSFVIEPNSIAKQTMQVYDVNGKLVLSQTINGRTNIDASILNEGVYNISVISDEGAINKRLVIIR